MWVTYGPGIGGPLQGSLPTALKGTVVKLPVISYHTPFGVSPFLC